MTPAAFEKTGSEERSKSACKPSCRPMAVHPPAAATIGKPAFEQAGRASVMVPPGERGVIVLRCSGSVLVAPMRVRAGSGRGPLSTSALVGAVKSTAAAESMVIRRSACGLCAALGASGRTDTEPDGELQVWDVKRGHRRSEAVTKGCSLLLSNRLEHQESRGRAARCLSVPAPRDAPGLR